MRPVVQKSLVDDRRIFGKTKLQISQRTDDTQFVIVNSNISISRNLLILKHDSVTLMHQLKGTFCFIVSAL